MLAKSSPVTVGAMAGTPTRILLADDHPLFRRGLREVLDAEDDLEVVAETGDGAEALDLAEREAIDLAVVDLVLPRMTGAELATELARRRPEVRVIILSAYDGEEHLVCGSPRRGRRLPPEDRLGRSRSWRRAAP